MIIKRVSVKRLRAIREKLVDFAPGLNIIKGSDNEAGKSSLRIAITKALFQDPSSNRNGIEALTSWGTDEPWEISLEFEAGGETYRISRSLKDRASELACIGAHEFIARNKNVIAEKIAELTGCPSETFFESTACIGQEEMIRLVPERARTLAAGQEAVGTITRRLQSKLSGTEEVDVSALLARLYSKTHRKEAAGPYSQLQRIAEQIASLRGQKVEQEQKISDILEKRRKLAQVREELDKIDAELPAKQELLVKNRKIIDLQKEINRDRNLYDAFQRARELKSRETYLAKELETYSAFAGADEEVKQVDATRRTFDELSRLNIALHDEVKSLEKQKPAWWLVAGAMVLVAAGLAGLIINPYLPVISLSGLFVGGYWAVTFRAWKKQMQSLAGKISSLETEIKANDEEARRLLERLGCKDYGEFNTRLAEYRSKSGSRRDALNQLSVLTAGKEWQKYAGENADLNIQMGAHLESVRELEPFKLEPLELQELEQRVNKLAARKNELDQDKGALDGFFEYTDADRDQSADIEERLKALAEEKDFWERKRAVYELTREILEESHKQTLSRAADLLEAEIARSISIVTEGKYRQVKINEADLSVSTFSMHKNDWVSVLDLSRATQDQFYICLRLALVKLITEARKPPILLDDPFVNFHARRLRQMISVLQDIAKDTQILLFTCSDAYDYLGDVVLIDEPFPNA